MTSTVRLIAAKLRPIFCVYFLFLLHQVFEFCDFFLLCISKLEVEIRVTVACLSQQNQAFDVYDRNVNDNRHMPVDNG